LAMGNIEDDRPLGGSFCVRRGWFSALSAILYQRTDDGRAKLHQPA